MEEKIGCQIIGGKKRPRRDPSGITHDADCRDIKNKLHEQPAESLSRTFNFTVQRLVPQGRQFLVQGLAVRERVLNFPDRLLKPAFHKKFADIRPASHDSEPVIPKGRIHPLALAHILHSTLGFFKMHKRGHNACNLAYGVAEPENGRNSRAENEYARPHCNQPSHRAQPPLRQFLIQQDIHPEQLPCVIALQCGKGILCSFLFGFRDPFPSLLKMFPVCLSFRTDFVRHIVPQILCIFQTPVNHIPCSVEVAENHFPQFFELVKIVPGLCLVIPAGIMQVPAGGNAQNSVNRFFPGISDVAHKLRHNDFPQFLLVQPVTSVCHTHEGFSVKLSHIRGQKINIIPPFRIFCIENAEKYIGKLNGSVDNGNMLVLFRAVRVRRINKEDILKRGCCMT